MTTKTIMKLILNRYVSSGRTSTPNSKAFRKSKNDNKDDEYLHLDPVLCVFISSYGCSPVGVITIAEAGGWRRLIRNAGHGFDGAAEEATIWRTLPEGPRASPLLRHGTESEARSRLGRKAAAQRLDLFRDERSCGDVCVTEIADLLQGLAPRLKRIHIQRG